MKINKKGFSLMELMVAVIIIGILAAIAMPYYQDHVEREKSALGISSLRMFADSLERYMALHNETVPTDLSLLDLDIIKESTTTYNDGNFIYSVVTSASDGNSYIKASRITGDYTLGYALGNDENNTADLVCSSSGTYCKDKLNMNCSGVTL